MKKIILTTLLLLLTNICNAAEKINIADYINKPYIGMEYYTALNQEIPLLLIFAHPNNAIYLARLMPIAQMVYEDFYGKYNFCIINTKIKENDELVEFFNPKKLPALYLINTKEKTYTFIEKKYYNKKSIKNILIKFKDGTLFSPSSKS